MTAVPDLYSHDFPVQRILESSPSWADVREKYREAFLIPYFNAKTLASDPYNFLRLLHTRTKHHFHEFVMVDKQEHRTGFLHGMLGMDFANWCVDMSHAASYGRLVHFNEADLHSWTIIGYPRAKLIIDAQVALYGNMRRVIGDLIGDTTEARGIAYRWNSYVSFGCRVSPFEQPWAQHPNTAFAGPPSIDHDHFCELAASRRAQAEDHLMLLQTDPQYAQRFISDWLRPIAMSRISEAFAEGSVMNRILVVSHKRARAWRSIETTCQYVRDLTRGSGEDKYNWLQRLVDSTTEL